jgi:hypothetical protein
MSTSLMGATPTVSKLKGTGYNAISVPTDPRTSQLWEQIAGAINPGLKGGGDFLSKLAAGGDEGFWNQLEAPALRQFGELQGNIASRFSGMGTGARRSSGFQNALGGAGADLAERLQSNRLGLQNQAIQQLFSMGQHLLGTPLSQTGFAPRQKPMWQELLMALAPGVGQALGGIGGGWGLNKLGLGT